MWPGSGGGSLASIGVSQYGNLRMARGLTGNSGLTGGFPDGFLHLSPNHISLHHIGSTWTGMLGHSSMLDHGAVQTAPFTTRWLTQTGTFSIASASTDSHFGIKAIAFPIAYATAPPILRLSLSDVSSYIVNIGSVATSGFSSAYSGLIAAERDITVYWLSSGTASI